MIHWICSKMQNMSNVIQSHISGMAVFTVQYRKNVFSWHKLLSVLNQRAVQSNIDLWCLVSVLMFLFWAFIRTIFISLKPPCRCLNYTIAVENVHFWLAGWFEFYIRTIHTQFMSTVNHQYKSLCKVQYYKLVTIAKHFCYMLCYRFSFGKWPCFSSMTLWNVQI